MDPGYGDIAMLSHGQIKQKEFSNCSPQVQIGEKTLNKEYLKRTANKIWRQKLKVLCLSNVGGENLFLLVYHVIKPSVKNKNKVIENKQNCFVLLENSEAAIYYFTYINIDG